MICWQWDYKPLCNSRGQGVSGENEQLAQPLRRKAPRGAEPNAAASCNGTSTITCNPGYHKWEIRISGKYIRTTHPNSSRVIMACDLYCCQFGRFPRVALIATQNCRPTFVIALQLALDDFRQVRTFAGDCEWRSEVMKPKLSARH